LEVFGFFDWIWRFWTGFWIFNTRSRILTPSG
jgi:hypothetical protein